MAKKIERPLLSRAGGFDYAIDWVPTGSIQVDGEDAWGDTDHVAQKIRVEDNLSPERECGILIHETLHQQCGVSKVAFHGTPEEIEEQICSFVGDAIAGHIRDNPDFWRYVLRRLAPRKRKKPNVVPGSST
jgi:hypothetical protein